jgi:hypothetical protein
MINSVINILENYSINFNIVIYEELIDDPFTKIKELIKFLDLEWQDDIYNYRDNIKGKNISTPSYQAITKKINKKQKGRWQNYKKQTLNMDVVGFYKKIESLKHKI